VHQLDLVPGTVDRNHPAPTALRIKGSCLVARSGFMTGQQRLPRSSQLPLRWT
jgi:hypothetical protein